jgi:thiol-disulfide isomerase/thioredoxin/TPR repeat protein
LCRKRPESAWLAVVALLLAAGGGSAQVPARQGLCAPSPEVRAALEEQGVSRALEVKSAQAPQAYAALQALLQRFPDDLFVHLQVQDLARAVYKEKLPEVIAQYQARAESRPEDPLYLYLYGRILTATDPEEAAKLYEKAVEKDAGFPRAHLGLAYVYTQTPARDPKKAREHLQAYLRLCPTSLEGYGYLDAIEDPDFKKSMVLDLRARIAAQGGPISTAAYPTLWKLEFATAAPPQYPTVRERVAADLAALRKLDTPADRQWLQTLQAGYEMTSDEAGARWVADQMLARFPDLPETRRQVLQSWQEAHPYPKDGDDAVVEAHSRELLKGSEDWVRRWPDDPLSWLYRARAVQALPETTAEEARITGERLLAAWEKGRETVQSYPETVPMIVAGLYLKSKSHLDLVPQLVEQGIAVAEENAKSFLASPGLSDEDRKQAEQEVDESTWSGWTILFDASAETGKKDQARKTLEKMDALFQKGEAQQPALDARMRLERRAELWTRMARLAELDGHKLEALAFYQTALVLGPQEASRWARKLAETPERRARKLWAELGGTPEGWDRWARSRRLQGAPQEAAGSAWEARDRKLPELKLADLQGKTWTLASVRGKAVFFNVWATWCGPCKAELPDVQKIYERLHGAPDAVLLTLNIDENPGLVEPFLQKAGYTFPVLLAAEAVDQLLEGHVSIPRSWIVDGDGVLRWEQFGYTSETDWVEKVLSRLGSVQRPKPKP